jgi:demethylmenaquinone methyltransferase/2-methoxy-6-polyprenyl-1,4-benzoquinol methylase
MTDNPKTAFFDGIAEKWDGWEDLAAMRARLAEGLEELGVGANETVLDVGCGTGNLTLALLARLSPEGRVVAVDISTRMIAEARRKVSDPRVAWHAADAARLPLPDASCDRAICCAVWPHFDDRAAAAAELRRVLRPAGLLHVWHLVPRGRVNEIHAAAGEAVSRDALEPAREAARLLERLGFVVTAAVDDARRYLVTAFKAAR